MERPYIISQLVMSIDGKVSGDFDTRLDLCPTMPIFLEKMAKERIDAYISGRATMQLMDFPETLDLSKYEGKKIVREDYVADKDAGFYCVVVDPHGRINWQSSKTNYPVPELDGVHIISILSESVSDEYLAYLQDLGISYMFGGDQEMDLESVAGRLYRYFGIEKAMITGGPTVNGYFAKAELIDQLNLVVAPITFPHNPAQQLYDVNDVKPMLYDLVEVEKCDKNVLWLSYKKNDLQY